MGLDSPRKLAWMVTHEQPARFSDADIKARLTVEQHREWVALAALVHAKPVIALPTNGTSQNGHGPDGGGEPLPFDVQ